LSRVGVTYKTGFGLDDFIYCILYIHTVRDPRQYSAIAILHTFQFTAAHALRFTVFTSRILATDLSQSHFNFKSHMMSSFHTLTPFFPLLCSCQFRRLESIQFRAHIPAGWRLKVRHLHFRLDYSTSTAGSRFLCPFITPRHGPHRKHSLYC
jgi:hypothetical protein